MDEYSRIRINRNEELVIFYDSEPMNPRTEWDGHIGKMACWHSNYKLGDEGAIPYGAEPDNFIAVLGGFNEDYHWSENTYRREFAKATKKAEREFTILPLYLYDHSGITMSTSSFSVRWDSGQVGWIYANNKEARKELGLKDGAKNWRKHIEAYLRAEVREYDCYLTGDVYGYVMEKNGEEIDSCWGFLGDNFLENGLLNNALSSKRTMYRIAREIGGKTGRSAPKKRKRA